MFGNFGSADRKSFLCVWFREGAATAGMCLRRKEKLRKKFHVKSIFNNRVGKISRIYRFIQTVLKDQRPKRPGLGWQFQGKK